MPDSVGTECVAKAAADYLEPAELNRLMIELDAIARGQKAPAASASASVGAAARTRPRR